MDEVRVKLLKRSDRKTFYLQYRDPDTGQKVRKATTTTKRRDAERLAAKWEKSIREGRDRRPGKIPWAEFRRRYEDEVLTGPAAATGHKVSAVFNTVEALLKPRSLSDLTAERLGKYPRLMRETGRGDTTIKGHLAHLRAALAGGVDVGLSHSVPKMPKIRRAKGTTATTPMKGRPITAQEFAQLLAKTEEVVGEAVAPSWRRLLWGLWWSGLRLGEALALSWDDPGAMRVTGGDDGHLYLRVPAESEKGHKDRILPVAPEFEEFLRETPVDQRKGLVLAPRSAKPGCRRIGLQHVSKILARIGKAAGVVVQTSPKVKYASAHDLRRSFGDRWSRRITPRDLRELMRHADIQTTMRYYIGQNAETTAAVLWDAYGRQLGTRLGTQAENVDSEAMPSGDAKSFDGGDL